MLEMGAATVNRLELVDRVYGSSSRALLHRAGLREGMRVVELGCGVGTMTAWLADQVGPAGSVIAVDTDDRHLEQAQRRCAGRAQTTFRGGDARQTELPEGQADVVYARLLLMRGPRAETVLSHAHGLLKEGGVVV